MKEEKIESQEVDEIREKIKKNKRINLILKAIFLFVLVVALGITLPMIDAIQRGLVVEMNL